MSSYDINKQNWTELASDDPDSDPHWWAIDGRDSPMASYSILSAVQILHWGGTCC
jgi:hypothetical protein